jgi:hypothetical protein
MLSIHLTPLLKLWVAVSAAATTVTAAEAGAGGDDAGTSSRFMSVCNHASEPTFGEIFSFVSPVAPDDLVGLAGAARDSRWGGQAKEEEEQEGRQEHHWLLVRAFRELAGAAAGGLAEVGAVHHIHLYSPPSIH